MPAIGLEARSAMDQTLTTYLRTYLYLYEL